MARDRSDHKKQDFDWDRAIAEVERARESNTAPDTSRFAELIKPTGGSK